MKEKKDLRSTMRDRRRSLTIGERARASERLCRSITRHPCFIRAGRIGIYYPSDGEIDLTSLVDSGPNRQFFLPVLPSRGERRLWFSPYQSGDRLIADRYGIPEPASRIRLRAESLDLLLVPLVAFDGEGGRVGMGGGFYDTSLSFLSDRARIRPMRVFGIAYQFQQIDKVPRESWDIPLHGVFTDSSFVSPV